MTAPRSPRSLLTLAAVFCALTSVQSARAAGSAASSALQITVEVIHPCAVDTSSAQGAGAFDAARRQALVLATQSSLAQSCGATETRVAVYDVHAITLAPSATNAGNVPQLDIEF